MVRDEQGYLTATHVIRTPELVEFDFELAGIYSRMLAWLLDGLIANAAAAAVIFVLSLLAIFASGVAGFLIFVVLFVANWGYFTVLEWRLGGQTPGKRALGLRVLQVSGVRIEFTHAALRNLLRAFDHLPFLYAVGGGAALLAPSRRRLGDVVAGTIVVRERRRKVPAGLASTTPVAQRPGALVRLEDRLRRTSIAERELLLSAALRREELEVSARLTLFGELSRYLQERFGVEKPEHLSDEKLVVEAVSALLRMEGAAPAAGLAARLPRG